MPRPKKSESPTEVAAEKSVVEKVRKPRKKKEQSTEVQVAEKPAPKTTAEKKKRVMSQAQLDALSKGRESLAKRRQEKKETNHN